MKGSSNPPWSSVPSGVKHLTSDNFVSELQQLDAALVMFYAPWCRHCQAAQPHFQDAADSLRSSTSQALAAVDCTVENEICQRAGVRGYPTFKLYVKGKYRGDFVGSRSKTAFQNYIKNAG